MLHANKLSPTLISRAIPAVDIPLSLLFVVKPVTYAPRVEKMLRSSRSPKFLDVNVTEYRSDGTECSGCWGVDEVVDEGEGDEGFFQNPDDQIDVNTVLRVSDPSSPLCVKMTGPPPVPTVRQVSRSHSHIEITWQDSLEGGGGKEAPSFGTGDTDASIIYSELDCNGYTVKVPCQVSSFRLFGIGHSQRHTFRVRSINAHGKGSWSGEACFETLKATLQFCAQCGAYQGCVEGATTLPAPGSNGLKVPTCTDCGFGAFCSATYPNGLKPDDH